MEEHNSESDDDQAFFDAIENKAENGNGNIHIFNYVIKQKDTIINELRQKIDLLTKQEIPNKLKFSNAVAGSSKNSTITRKHLSGALHEVSTSNKCQEIIELGKNDKKRNDEEKWKTLQRKKHRRQIVVSSNNTIQVNGRHVMGVPKYVDLHVYRVDPSMHAKDLGEYVKSHFPEVKCQSLKSKYPEK
ncbi:hypothetical protein JTB14_015240 [Gonioctena quinquepunctata]|nr:hypothetical protein JTB14_015240 [Gonioctena quinquepunctata]